MKRLLHGILIILLIPVLFGFSPGTDKPVKIALTRSSPNYINWIHRGDSAIVIVDLNGLKPDRAELALQDCDGLILTGGGDIDPMMYKGQGQDEEIKDVDKGRDLLEKNVTQKAMVLKIPILGICRGEQMLNVLAGGTLITDIPSYKKIKETENQAAPGSLTGLAQVVDVNPGHLKSDTALVIHQSDDYLHCYHTVWLERSSMLRQITGVDTGFVASNHHQAILLIGNGLKKNASAGDGIIEGVEWKDPSGKSFLLAVQWHPERMELSNPFSGKILQRFLDEVKKYKTTLKNGK